MILRPLPPGVRRAALGLWALLFAAVGSAASAKEPALRGAEMKGFGRISLVFERPTKVSVRSTGSILIVSLGGGASMPTEKLAGEMPTYLALARTDPDGRAIRLALKAPFRANVLEAGEKVFIDLLPSNWTGLLPGLPPDVVEELARRAGEAEARLREKVRPTLPEPASGAIRVARLPNALRLLFQVPRTLPVEAKGTGRELSVEFGAAVKLDDSETRDRLEPMLDLLKVDTSGTAPRVRVVLGEGYEAKFIRDDDGLAVTIARPQEAAALLAPAAEPAPRGEGSRAAVEPESVAAAKPAPPPAEPAPRSATVLPASPPKPPVASVPSERIVPGGIVRPKIVAQAQGVELGFRFSGRVAAAAFERAGVVTAVFETEDPVEIPAVLPKGVDAFVTGAAAAREGRFAVLRLTLARPDLIRLVPAGEQGWTLTVGEAAGAGVPGIVPVRRPDGSGRSSVALPLAGASGVHWLDRNGQGGREPTAVVTAFGPPSGLSKPQVFQEFSLLPSAHGAVVLPRADDLIVQTAPDRVVVSKPGGLTLSPPEGVAGGGDPDIIFDRLRFAEDQGGSILGRIREKMRAVADAPKSERVPLRLDLARLLLANGLAPEAAGVLAATASDEASLATKPKFALLQGVAAARTNRNEEARRLLASDSLSADPEAALWLAVLDARARRWPQAMAGFRRGAGVLERYPDELQTELRLLAGRAALEANDQAYAQAAITDIGRLSGASGRGDLALLQARVDEAAGRIEPAIGAYKSLSEGREPPVAAEATLHLVRAALKAGQMSRDDAIEKLEKLRVAWRGGDLEAETITQLGRLYADAGRWRDAFELTRMANRFFPDNETTRGLHAETARQFEELFSSGKGDTLSRIDALALYFDFKEFTPIGRTGDEMVRHLADRLADLDLLDEAATLLQHQVDTRLNGPARAIVAARLATINLMAGKPQQALATLRSTWTAELSSDLKRARLLLEARALSDTKRPDLALDTLAGEGGPEVDRLRADILWTAKRWREAGEAQETILGARWREPAPLTDREQRDVSRAAIAYSLASEALSLDRIRTRYGLKMAETPEARSFAFLTQPGAGRNRASGDPATGVTRAETLSEFLKDFKSRFPDVGAKSAKAGAPERAAEAGR